MISNEIVRKWFMIHTYTGYEKKVKDDLKQKIENLGLSNIVFDIMVPEEQSKEIVRGKEKIVFRKLFPGYVMVEMEAVREETDTGINFKVDSEAWFVIRNTNGVTGFVGVGSDPIPMEDHEVENIYKLMGIKTDLNIDFEVGDLVEILEGAFENQTGRVAEINKEQLTVKVMVEMFGRKTPVEININSVRRA